MGLWVRPAWRLCWCTLLASGPVPITEGPQRSEVEGPHPSDPMSVVGLPLGGGGGPSGPELGGEDSPE